MVKDRGAAAAAPTPADRASTRKVRAKTEKPGMLTDNYTVNVHGSKNLNKQSRRKTKKKNGRPSSRP